MTLWWRTTVVVIAADGPARTVTMMMKNKTTFNQAEPASHIHIGRYLILLIDIQLMCNETITCFYDINWFNEIFWVLSGVVNWNVCCTINAFMSRWLFHIGQKPIEQHNRYILWSWLLLTSGLSIDYGLTHVGLHHGNC